MTFDHPHSVNKFRVGSLSLSLTVSVYDQLILQFDQYPEGIGNSQKQTKLSVRFTFELTVIGGGEL